MRVRRRVIRSDYHLMIFLSSNPMFGELTDRETFVFYDRPLLFTASNAAGHMYLVNWLDEDKGVDEWLIVPISAARLNAARSRRLSLADLFTIPETGIVWRIRTGPRGELVDSTSVSPQALSTDDLPAQEAMLVSETATGDNPEISEVPVSELAKGLALPVVYLKLYPHSSKHDAPARELGEMLTSLQDVFSAQSPRWKRVRRKPLKAPVGTSMSWTAGPQLRVLGSFQSSFGLKLALLTNLADAEQNSAFSNVVGLISAAGNVANLESELSDRSKQTVSALTRFFKSATNADSPLELEAASPEQPEEIRVELPAFAIRDAYNTLQKKISNEVRERTVVAELVGINIRARTFEIRDIKTGNLIKGKIGREIFNEFEKASVPDRYRIILEEHTFRMPTGSVRTDWVLANATRVT